MAGIDEACDIENQKRIISEKLDNLSSPSTSPCIYRVPKRLRRKNEEAYTPQVVSIGPLHHGNKSLEAMEEHKLRYLRYFLNRTEECLSDYIQMIKDQEEKLQGFYAEPIVFDKGEFVRTVLVDAAFVIEFLLRYYQIYSEGKDYPPDYIFEKPGMLGDVLPDLLLLENQLPFFILQELFNTLSSSHQGRSLLEISYFFFKGEFDIKGKEEEEEEEQQQQRTPLQILEEKNEQKEVQHFVDLIRILILCQHSASQTEKKHNSKAVPNLTELLQAGAKIEEGTGSSLLDIEFSSGILKIPKLKVDDNTYLKLRNLLAFEQCHHGEEDYLANYVFLMKRLVKTPEDVQLLVEKGIIDNWLADTQKVCTLLCDLGTGMMVDDRHYAPHCQRMIDFRKNPCRGWMVTLKQKYFNNPWSSLSVAAAVTVLVLTIIIAACAYKATPLL